MINKRLLNLMGDSKRYIALNVLSNWINLIAQIISTFSISKLLDSFLVGTITPKKISDTAIVVGFSLISRFTCDYFSARFSYLASKDVKRYLRDLIYNKLLKLGMSYNEKIATSEVVQITCEGVEQLEVYFGKYVPQFFYSMLAPVTLFFAFCFVSWRTATLLLLCVPLIPISIIAISKYAKRLLSKYWGVYLTLGDSFLENVQGLTTLKIYQSDEYKNEEMNVSAEKFRQITMKVLFMQLASIIIMDLVAYGGAGGGIIMAVRDYKNGIIGFRGCIALIILSAEFFLPLRLLGSFFHVAMNGMSASTKIFHLLDLEEEAEKPDEIEQIDIELSNVDFAYIPDRQVLSKVSLSVPENNFISIVGNSGCGKSTIAALINGANKMYTGTIKIGGKEIKDIKELNLMRNITTVSHNSYIFKGTFRYNLIIAKPNATDDELNQALKEVNLYDFVKSQNGLETEITENGSNLSGGQRQRLAIARALLADSKIYIFDEATSNIDVESELLIMKVVHNLAKTKSIILISHRLANVVNSDIIYVIDKGSIVEKGNHNALMEAKGHYCQMYTRQKNLEDGIH